MQAPDPAGVAAVADAALAWVRLARTPRPERRLALILSDYPARGGRAGFAVGLDTPASACAILDFLGEAGYAAERDFSAETLMPRLTEGEPAFSVPLAAYQDWLAALPEQRRADLLARWGAPEDDPAARGEDEFRFRAVRAGRVLVALQPDRGRGGDRKGAYHDPDLPPTHAYLAFYLGLRTQERIDALIHLGAHGTAEWLPGKAVALSEACWPRLAVGATPVIYPFIVDDPGEAAPAKRRIGAVTLGHLPPPVAHCRPRSDDMPPPCANWWRNIRPPAMLDPRRADLVAREILERAQASGPFRRRAASPWTRPSTRRSPASTRICAIWRGFDPGRAARLRRWPRRASKPARRASAKTFCAPSTAASSRPARPVRPRAGGATCCRPGATFSPSTPAPSRPAPPPGSARGPPPR